MTDFQLFDLALKRYETPEKISDSICLSDSFSEASFSETEEEICEISCKHLDFQVENGLFYCLNCGEQIDQDFVKTKDSRYFDTNDSLYTMDPGRCQMRKSDQRSIYKDVENMGFSEMIVELANKIYSDVTKESKKSPDGQDVFKISRGKTRRALVFACIFHAYKLSGNPQSCESLITSFNLDKKAGLNGLKQVNLNAPKKSPVRTTYITAGNLISEIMDKFQATIEQKQEVMSIYEKVENRSSSLNRSRPQSVAAGVIYYWICSTKKEITIKEFTEIVNLSELTVNKKSKEIARVLGTELKIEKKSKN
jgi:transcription initiation factor TFIIIB Brf1 subunit/transcription initiation factor TFIIB